MLAVGAATGVFVNLSFAVRAWHCQLVVIVGVILVEVVVKIVHWSLPRWHSFKSSRPAGPAFRAARDSGIVYRPTRIITLGSATRHPTHTGSSAVQERNLISPQLSRAFENDTVKRSSRVVITKLGTMCLSGKPDRDERNR